MQSARYIAYCIKRFARSCIHRNHRKIEQDTKHIEKAVMNAIMIKTKQNIEMLIPSVLNVGDIDKTNGCKKRQRPWLMQSKEVSTSKKLIMLR